MEPAPFWGLAGPDRSFQTTLSGQAPGNLSAEQSASARLRIRVSLGLQGSKFSRGGTQVTGIGRIARALKLAKPGIGKIISRTIGGPTRWIHFPVWSHWNRSFVSFAATLSQIADEFLA